jgi:serine/threonine-protein kinase RsbW
MERRFQRVIGAVEDVFAFVSDFAGRNGLDDAVTFKLSLAIEELFVNMVEHNPQSHSDILISLAKDGGRLTVSLTDFDVEPFDITKADRYDSSQPLEERPVGHLGIHLVRSMVDDISYQYKDRQSRITLIKDLGKNDVQDRTARQ